MLSIRFLCLSAMLTGCVRSPIPTPPADTTLEATRGATQPLGWLKSKDFAALDTYFTARQRSYESGAISDEALYESFRALYEDSAANEQYFTAWVETFPKSYPARMARGAYYYRMAWFVRGINRIRKTSDEQIQAMHRYLAQARPDLIASLQMTRKPYLSTLYLINATTLEGDRDERRRWFEKGYAIDPNNVLVRLRYMFSLRPRWGGSYAEMSDFFAECKRQGAPLRTLAKLELMIRADFAEEDQWKTLSAAKRYEFWKEVLALQKVAGEPPTVNAVMGSTRAAWDLHRRDEADRGLEQLAGMQVREGWALSQMGWIYAQENRMAEAWAVLVKAAELNDPWAQFSVGKTTYLGCPDIHVPADRSAGLAWIQRSADQNFEEARAFLTSAARAAVSTLGGDGRRGCVRQSCCVRSNIHGLTGNQREALLFPA